VEVTAAGAHVTSLPRRPRPLPPLAGRRPKGSTGAILDRRQTRRRGVVEIASEIPERGLNSRSDRGCGTAGPDNAFR
jgi:hypothetical protein